MTRHVIGQKCHVIGKRVYKHHVTIQLIRQQRSQRIKNIAAYSKSTRRWQSKYFHQNKFLVFKCLFLNSPCSIEHHSYFILTQTWSSSCQYLKNVKEWAFSQVQYVQIVMMVGWVLHCCLSSSSHLIAESWNDWWFPDWTKFGTRSPWISSQAVQV